MSTWRKMRGFFLSEEELGKKDDDRKTSKNGAGLRQSTNWHPTRVPPRRSLKRLALGFIVALLIYLFFRNIPVLGPDQRMRRPNYASSDLAAAPKFTKPSPPGRAPPSRYNARPATAPEQAFNGPVKFLELAATLHAIGDTKGSMPINRNILFASSSLKSSATLLPIACQMASELKNYVHFALMSRSEISIQELRKVNGIDHSCPIIFHDARPDHVALSADDRMENAVFRAFHHIYNYMHPQATFVDGSSDEEPFFLRAAQQHTSVKQNTLIELPRKSAKGLEWLSKLDSQSLHKWNKIHIDILIHTVPGASGSLIRLLRSLSEADYTPGSVPHLTIELPHRVDPPTKYFLETFMWPPPQVYNPTNAQYLSLRRRTPYELMNEEESSARFLESFWPTVPENSHVLVLSPQAELSPQFFHYLKYSLLEYRYSAMSAARHWDRQLFGISLEQPLKLLDGKGELNKPPPQKNTGWGDQGVGDAPSSFLWQAPTSNAILILGEKWMELHDFVSRSLEVKRNSDPAPPLLTSKVVSTQYPSWLEHALRLARARGYWTLYPGDHTARNLATVHNELHRMPEEYTHPGSPTPLLADDASDRDIEEARQKIRSGPEVALAPVSMLDSLTHDGNLRPLGDLPALTWDGLPIDSDELYSLSREYAKEFREKVGGCSADSTDTQKQMEDLFCVAN
ncbi:hypothetical protein GGS23DRAFT_32064 [Durotheca rogersii]|uniref:uncharacterized protein n=1 Tax=Durotheca rogersii TaxID=419775 RepID=UPI0022208717|nr:uncharacterized protein GGS23DRAFT_32064 [Durotheca rogersii]KAI5868471.1 hypothetical protein GGS23DRAFT_32064 [Durotheca rogersii]